MKKIKKWFNEKLKPDFKEDPLGFINVVLITIATLIVLLIVIQIYIMIRYY